MVDAIRLVPSRRRARGLRRTRLGGELAIDPRRRDFFLAVIEERQTARRAGRPEDERRRLDSFLKVLANSASYGIYAEMVREELPGRKEETVDIFGAIDRPFVDDVPAPEKPGDFTLPPIAACITGAARLMLALLERAVADAGGTYAFCDTDSMAVVATEDGGPVRCEGGEDRLPDNSAAINALSWDAVDDIRERFASLNPYDRDAVAGSVLEIEDQNFETRSRARQRQLYCYAISAKRYALYSLNESGRPVLRKGTETTPGEKWSEHGLGHLLNPLDHDGGDRDWIRALWKLELLRATGHDSSSPDWLSRPAIGSLTIGKPRTLDPFATLNAGKAYGDTVKPFNFLLTAHLPHFAAPPGGENPGRFQLLAPYESDPSKWLELGWLNKYVAEEQSYRLTTGDSPPPLGTARVQSYADVLAEYRVHPEPKSLAPTGKPAGWHGNGLLARRAVVATRLVHVGKESNELEEKQAGVVHDPGEAVNEHLAEDAWLTVVVPVLNLMPRAALRKHLSGSRISQLRASTLDPGRKAEASLTRLAGEFAREELQRSEIVPPAEAVDCCAAYLESR